MLSISTFVSKQYIRSKYLTGHDYVLNLLISHFVAYDDPSYFACLKSVSFPPFSRAPLLMSNSQFLSPVVLVLKKNLKQHLHLKHFTTCVSAGISNDTFGLKVVA